MRAWMMTLMICLVPAPVVAGAWPREPGSFFLSAGYTVSVDAEALGDTPFQANGYTSVYLEYGVSERLTFGIDAGMGAPGDHTAIAFARTPIRFGSGSDRFAIKAGIGTTRNTGLTQSLVQIGASWGRSIQTGYGNGWMSLDTSVDYRLMTQDIDAKVDLTLGIKPNDRTKLMLQVQSGSAPYLRLAPSAVRQIGPGRHVELGLDIGVIGDKTVGLKLGSWLEF